MHETATRAAVQRPAPRTWLRWLVGAVLAGGIAGAVLLGQTGSLQGSSDASPVSHGAPAPDRNVRALGEVLPVTNLLTVSGPSGQDEGRIARILVAEGDGVAAGDTLAIMDTEPLQKALVDQAKANEAVRRAALAAKSADVRATEQQLQAQIDEQKVALEKAQVELGRMTKLRDTGLYEDSALVNLRLDVQSATFNLKNTEIQLARNRLRNDAGMRLDEASAVADLDAAIAARAKAEADYARAIIRAPIDGRILTVHGRIGEQIGAKGFAEMGDTRQMMVRAEVYESDSPAIELGQVATVTSRAMASGLSGTVLRKGVRISNQSILSTDPAAIVDARVVEVWIALDDQSSATVRDLSGLQVTVTFQTGKG